MRLKAYQILPFEVLGVFVFGGIKMSKQLKAKSRADYYYINSDFSGSRNVSQNNEAVSFRNNKMLRIWYNDLPASFEAHCHSAMEIIVPIENFYEVIIGDTAYKVNPNEIIIIPPRIMHELKAPESGVRFIYQFDISFMEKLSGYQRLESSLFTKPIYLQEASPLYEEFNQGLLLMRNEYFDNREFNEFTIYAVLLNIFSKLAYNTLDDKEFINLSTGKQNDYAKKFRGVLNYIDGHYAEDIDMEKIADDIGFSKYHFSRLFKKYTNFTFCDYINYRRIKVAEELLSGHELTITEVALSSGFTSISTFNRLFKQYKGCSPSEYRARCMTIDFTL